MTPKNHEIKILGARATPKNHEIKILGEHVTPNNKGFSILGAFLPELRILFINNSVSTPQIKKS